jgi:hypothetical protein
VHIAAPVIASFKEKDLQSIISQSIPGIVLLFDAARAYSHSTVPTKQYCRIMAALYRIIQSNSRIKDRRKFIDDLMLEMENKVTITLFSALFCMSS